MPSPITIEYDLEDHPDPFIHLACECGNSESQPADQQTHHLQWFKYHHDWQAKVDVFECRSCGVEIKPTENAFYAGIS